MGEDWELQREEDRLTEQLTTLTARLSEMPEGPERASMKAELDQLTSHRDAFAAAIPYLPSTRATTSSVPETRVIGLYVASWMFPKNAGSAFRIAKAPTAR